MTKKISDQENIAGLRLSLEEQHPIQDYVGDDKEFQTSEEWVTMIDTLLEQEVLKVKSMGTEGAGDDVTADTLYVTLNDAGEIDTEFPVGPANIDQFKKQYPKDAKIMFVGEGGMTKGDNGNIEFSGEQKEFRDGMLGHYPNAEESSWDENANVYDNNSPVYKHLEKEGELSQLQSMAAI